VHITDLSRLNKTDQQAALAAAVEAARQSYIFGASAYSFEAMLTLFALRDRLDGPDWIECYRESRAGSG
jgi:hypothetical protein